tara:strand:- start:979 stop:1398 length:420 start_codon:yes stop_codon:yes gene_type:complete
MFCSQCGVDNNDSASFCKTCGVSLASHRISFSDAISLAFKNYVNFKGRSTRAEYWWFFLFTFTLSAITEAIDVFSSLGIMSTIFSLIVFMPSLTVGVRRLHDINKSGWWILMWFVPIVGWGLLIFWYTRRSDEKINRYG